MLLIKNAHIKTITGPELENGCILVDDDGKILQIAESIDAPVNAAVIDAEGRLTTPGCVEAHCHIGLHNACLRWEGADYNETTTDPVTPHMRAIDSIYPMDEYFTEALRGGVTTACTGPGSANVVGGTFAAIKLYGNRIDDMIVFSQLKREDIRQIAFRLTEQVTKRLADLGIILSLSEEALDLLAEKGFDAAYGARPLRRAIQTMLEDPLAEKMLGEEFTKGDTVTVNVVDGKLEFSKQTVSQP